MSIAILKTDGTITQPNDMLAGQLKHTNSIDWYQKQIAGPEQQSGWIEIVWLQGGPISGRSQPMQMIANEEGLLLNLEINTLATLLYSARCGCKNETPIVGDVIILTGGDCLD